MDTIIDDRATIHAIVSGEIGATTQFWNDADDETKWYIHTQDNHCAVCDREITDDAKLCVVCSNRRKAAVENRIRRLLVMVGRGEVEGVVWP